jgi:rod shape-determining protein MreD
MQRSFLAQFDALIRKSLPILFTLLLLCISLIPRHLSGFGQFVPLFSFMAIYYWALFHPSSMPYWFVFALGLLQDIFFGMPLGLSSLLFIGLRASVIHQGALFSREAFWFIWFGFAMFSSIFYILGWLLVSFYYQQSMPYQAALIQCMLTIFVYPIIHWSFNKLYALLPKMERY